MNAIIHNIYTILQASRILMFDNKNEDYEYTIGGSSFLVKIEEFLFAITAKHVLENNHYSPDDVLIRYNEESRYFLPFEKIFYIDTDDTNDTDHKDVVFLKVAKSLLNAKIDTGFIIKLPHKRSLPRLDCEKLLITGFPKDLSRIDYERKHIKTVRKPLIASNPNFSQYRGLFSFQYEQNTAEDLNFNGLSGSPVFCLLISAKNR